MKAGNISVNFTGIGKRYLTAEEIKSGTKTIINAAAKSGKKYITQQSAPAKISTNSINLPQGAGANALREQIANGPTTPLQSFRHEKKLSFWAKLINFFKKSNQPVKSLN